MKGGHVARQSNDERQQLSIASILETHLIDLDTTNKLEPLPREHGVMAQ